MNRRQASGNGLRRQCATILKSDGFCKESALSSGNGLRGQCATIPETDGFCKESEWKSGNELGQSTCRLNMKLMSAESGSLQPRPISVVSLFKLTIAFHSTVSITSDKPLLVLFKQLLSLRMESVTKMIRHKFQADIIFVFGAKLHPQICTVAVTLSISPEYHKHSWHCLSIRQAVRLP